MVLILYGYSFKHCVAIWAEADFPPWKGNRHKDLGGHASVWCSFCWKKHDIFIFSFFLARKLAFGISPVFCTLLFYAARSIFLQKFWQHFLSLQKYCKWTTCFHFTSALRPPVLCYWRLSICSLSLDCVDDNKAVASQSANTSQGHVCSKARGHDKMCHSVDDIIHLLIKRKRSSLYTILL